MGFHGRQRFKSPPTIRYGIVDSKEIDNKVLVPDKTTYGSLNPGPSGYLSGCNAIGGRGMQPVVHRLRTDEDYYVRFEKDLVENGFRNPCLCWSFENGTYVVYGTTRMYLAKKAKLKVPVFICDWVERWTNLQLITSKEQALGKFTDKPIELVYEKDFFNFFNSRNEYDPYECKIRETAKAEARRNSPMGDNGKKVSNARR